MFDGRNFTVAGGFLQLPLLQILHFCEGLTNAVGAEEIAKLRALEKSLKTGLNRVLRASLANVFLLFIYGFHKTS